MFPPETPPPSKFRRRKAPPAKNEGSGISVRVFQILFIVLGIGAIAAILVIAPKGKRLVCDRTTMTRSSLTSFGSCRGE